VWTSSTGSGSASLAGSVVATDAPGTAGNTAPVTYLSGAYTNKVFFPEVYSALTEMSICTVSRYTSTIAAYRQRIFQPHLSSANWLHGQYR
jgi:hypothetical protein